jgi:hypothetical protein
MHKRLRLDSLCAPILLIVGLCPLSIAQSLRHETSVAPLPDEDIASSCHYELTIPSQVKKVMAVWVIFDRGRDVHELYSDEAVLQFAKQFRIALLLHGHCPGKRPEDHNDWAPITPRQRPAPLISKAKLRQRQQRKVFTFRTIFSQDSMIVLDLVFGMR